VVEELEKLDDRGAIEKGHSSHDSYDFTERSGGYFGCMHVFDKLLSDVTYASMLAIEQYELESLSFVPRTLHISVPGTGWCRTALPDADSRVHLRLRCGQRQNYRVPG
jgi:hypothetical protein